MFQVITDLNNGDIIVFQRNDDTTADLPDYKEYIE